MVLPDWRWQLAVEQSSRADNFFRGAPDHTVRVAKQFYRAWSRCRNEADQSLLADQMPTLACAHALYRDRRSPVRHALEARLLTPELLPVIAEKCALPTSVVACFADLFFDVRDHLEHPGYILHHVLGSSLHGGTGSWKYDVTWKFFAYVGGVSVLEELMQECVASAKPTNPVEAAAFLSEANRAAFRRQLVVAAHAIGLGDSRTQSELLRFQGQLILKQNKEEGGASNSIDRHIQALLDDLPWVMGTNAEEALRPELAQYDRLAVELRDEEVQRVAAGEKIPALEEAEFPEAKRKQGATGSTKEIVLE